MLEFRNWSEELSEELIRFRLAAYTRRRRDKEQASAWSNDHYDPVGVHAILRDAQREIIGAVRILDPDKGWALDAHHSYPYERNRSLEFGRLAVSQRSHSGRRVMFDLIRGACEYCVHQRKDIFYGLVITELANVLKKESVPIELLGGVASPYGHPTTLIKFDVQKIVEFYPVAPRLDLTVM